MCCYSCRSAPRQLQCLPQVVGEREGEDLRGGQGVVIYIYIYICIHTHTHIYIYIERERDVHVCMCIYTYIYIGCFTESMLESNTLKSIILLRRLAVVFSVH